MINTLQSTSKTECSVIEHSVGPKRLITERKPVPNRFGTGFVSGKLSEIVRISDISVDTQPNDSGNVRNPNVRISDVYCITCLAFLIQFQLHQH